MKVRHYKPVVVSTQSREDMSVACYNTRVYLLTVCLLSICLSTNCIGIQRKNTNTPIGKTLIQPEVRIPQGLLRGVNMMTRHKRTIFGFKGIPFAQPPVGNLRFKTPVPAAPWHGTYDASRDSNPCPQFDVNTKIIGDEDCLHVNVYTPQLPASENTTLLPVMLFVYGGAFRKGSITSQRWPPTFILDKDVLLVVPNYRMGALGYLSTGDEISPGNYGLKDLALALEWVRDNVQYFGGDPNQVTLFGGSSGAMCVHLLTLCESTNGLFHRYLTNSGSALTMTAVQTPNVHKKYALQLGKYVGCPTNSSKDLVECLRGVDVAQLVNATLMFFVWNEFPYSIWGPTVEPNVEGALLVDTPTNLYAAGKVRDLPWMCMVTRDEGIIGTALFHTKPDKFQELLDNIDVLLPIICQYNNAVDNVTAYTAALKSYYMSDLTIDKSLLLANLTQFMGDLIFLYPVYKGFQQHSGHARNPHFLCSFDYQGTPSHTFMYSRGYGKSWGVFHGDELHYLLPGPKGEFMPRGIHEMTKNDWRMVDTMVQLWTSFVINGTPSTLETDGTRTTLEPYSTHGKYLQIGNGPNINLEMKDDFHLERMRFFEELDSATSWHF